MAQEDTTEILSDTAQGAKAGYSVGGGWGALIGGVLGFGAGLWSSGRRKKARKLQAGARALRQDAVLVRSFAEQRNLLRAGQVQAAMAQQSVYNSGADVESSASQGIQSSIYTQLMDNFLIGEKIVGDQIRANAMDQSASRETAKADAIQAGVSAIAGGANSFGGSGFGSSSSGGKQ
jgi:hypothetical protein